MICSDIQFSSTNNLSIAFTNFYDGEQFFAITDENLLAHDLLGKSYYWLFSLSKPPITLAGLNIKEKLETLKEIHNQYYSSYLFPFSNPLELSNFIFPNFGILSLDDVCGRLNIEPPPSNYSSLTGARKIKECFEKIMADE